MKIEFISKIHIYWQLKPVLRLVYWLMRETVWESGGKGWLEGLLALVGQQRPGRREGTPGEWAQRPANWATPTAPADRAGTVTSSQLCLYLRA